MSKSQAQLQNDEEIARAALNALKRNIWVPSEDLQISVSNGLITLEGEVDYQYQRSEAERSLRELAGVNGVTNLIQTKKPSILQLEITTKIGNALRHAAEADSEKIEVRVEGDKVVLCGEVSSWAERQEAEQAARSAPGVGEVDDRLIVAI